jgi:N-acetylglucosamine-6-phosphate deacetylase
MAEFAESKKLARSSLYFPMTLTITNARVVGMSGLQAIVIDDHQVAEAPMPMATLERLPDAPIDVAGDWISPGGLDLQINGALGLAFPELQMSDLDKLDQICRTLWNAGVDGFAPTIVTTSIENIQRSLAVIAAFQAQQAQTSHPAPAAQIIGVHLEGPFLNPVKRGAHPEEFLLPLTLDQLDRVLGDHADRVKIVTLAPELDPTGETIAALRDRGIVVSLGHSLATADQASQAFELGAAMVTHAFNAMPGLHHRDPGLLGAAIVDSRVYSGLIADGQHVCQTMLKILLRSDPSNLFLVSDALSPLGLPDGTYPWDEREIVVTDGTARLHDGTLSGTTRPLMDGADNLVNWGLCDLERAIDLVSHAPRRAIGLPFWDTTPGSAYRLLRWSQAEDGTISRSRPFPCH